MLSDTTDLIYRRIILRVSLQLIKEMRTDWMLAGGSMTTTLT